MGEVYLAHDTSLGRKIALKLLPADFTIDDERVRRFQQEARAASALNHPNILTIYQIGQVDNRPFIATEFIEGRTLRQIAKGSALSLNHALDIATQIAGALAAAHQAGIVHRDIKPDGRYIVFVSKRAGGPQVWRVDIDGGNPKQLTHGAGAFNPFISPDGKWVFYLDGADIPRASKVSIDGGEPLGLTSPFSEIVPRGFSPDGKLIAYRPSGVPPGRKGIGIASTEDGKPIKIVDLPRNTQWTPDGQSITYADFRDGASNLWLLPLDGRPPKQLTNFKDKEGRMQNFAWSRDGKYLVFNRTFQASISFS